LPLSVCLSVCLSDCRQITQKRYQRILIKSWTGGRGQRNNRLDFGGDPGHDLGPRLSK